MSRSAAAASTRVLVLGQEAQHAAETTAARRVFGRDLAQDAWHSVSRSRGLERRAGSRALRTSRSRPARASCAPLRVSATVRTRRSVGCGRRSASPCSSSRSTSQVTFEASHFQRAGERAHRLRLVGIERGGARASRPGLSPNDAAICGELLLAGHHHRGQQPPRLVGGVADRDRLGASCPDRTAVHLNASSISTVDAIDT